MEGVYAQQNNFPPVKIEPGLNGSGEHGDNPPAAQPPTEHKEEVKVKEEPGEGERSSKHKDDRDRDRDRDRKRSRDRKRRRSRSRDRDSRRRYCIQLVTIDSRFNKPICRNLL